MTKTVTAPPQVPQTRPVPSSGNQDKPLGASAAGAGDGFCHWYRSPTLTYCGLMHPPLRHLHQEPPCPNDNPPCQFCVEKYDAN